MKSQPVIRRFGLCGFPIAHSLSPRLFEAAYPQGNFSYELIEASTPAEALRLFTTGGFWGMNVTAPFKTSILPLTHRQTEECAAIGACNIIIKEGDVLVAYNTDYLGVARSLEEAKTPVKNTECLLLGAGGAAKATAYSLLKAGANLLWANRTPTHIPYTFCGHPITPLSLAQAVDYLPACSLVVNTLPLSVPETQILSFKPTQIILDASYSSRPLEKQARQAGAKYIGGERWLLHQAIPSFELMTQIPPDIEAMEQLFMQIIFYTFAP